jgi:PAS domain S-box-containing protein
MGHKTSRILLVEDEAIIALSTVKTLRNLGYEVAHVLSGEAALELFRPVPGAAEPLPPFDLVLMDINLGAGMDGTDTAREILKIREVPIVFLSSHSEEEIVEKTERISSYGYVVKKSGINILDASIRMAFRLFEAHGRLALSEEKFYKAFSLSPDSININRLSDGVYIDINDGFTRITGYSREDVMGRSSLPGDLGIWTRASDRDRLLALLRESGEASNLEAEFRRKDGSTLTGLMSARVVEVGGEKCVLSITRDITERKIAENNLRSLNRVQAVVGKATQLILRESDQQRLLDGACRIAVEEGRLRMAWIGMADEAAGLVKPVASAGAVDGYLDAIEISLSDLPSGRGPTGTAARTGQISVCADIERDGRMVWKAEALARGYRSMASFPLRSGQAVIGVFNVYSDEVGFFRERETSLLEQLVLDISFALASRRAEELHEEAERKLRESERLYRESFMQSSAVKLLVDPDSKAIVDANAAASAFYGYPIAALKGMKVTDLNVASPEEVSENIGRARDRRQQRFEFRHRLSSGDVRDVEVFSSPIELGGTVLLHSIVHDITEQKRAGERLKQLVLQKETLMKELQHRVKNNLNVISGLIGLEAEKCDDAKSKQAFSEVMARVDSIAAIYDRLVKSEDASSVELGPYVEDLARSLFASYNLDPARIALKVKSGDARLDTRRSVPFALILNELVSNALKYAYPGEARGEVRIELEAEGEELKLTVSDDGVGIPEEYLSVDTSSTGMMLVRMLTEQLKGWLRIDAAKGTRISVSFSARSDS